MFTFTKFDLLMELSVSRNFTLQGYFGFICRDQP